MATERWHFTFSQDASIDEDERPELIFVHPTFRQAQRITGLVEEVKEAGDAFMPALGSALDEISTLLVDWRNICDAKTGDPIAFGDAELGDVLDTADALELCQRFVAENLMQGFEKKKSGLALLSATTNAAEGAEGEAPPAEG